MEWIEIDLHKTESLCILTFDSVIVHAREAIGAVAFARKLEDVVEGFGGAQ
jgi:hypothetical protein